MVGPPNHKCSKNKKSFLFRYPFWVRHNDPTIGHDTTTRREREEPLRVRCRLHFVPMSRITPPFPFGWRLRHPLICLTMRLLPLMMVVRIRFRKTQRNRIGKVSRIPGRLVLFVIPVRRVLPMLGRNIVMVSTLVRPMWIRNRTWLLQSKR